MVGLGVGVVLWWCLLVGSLFVCANVCFVVGFGFVCGGLVCLLLWMLFVVVLLVGVVCGVVWWLCGVVWWFERCFDCYCCC